MVVIYDRQRRRQKKKKKKKKVQNGVLHMNPSNLQNVLHRSVYVFCLETVLEISSFEKEMHEQASSSFSVAYASLKTANTFEVYWVNFFQISTQV